MLTSFEASILFTSVPLALFMPLGYAISIKIYMIIHIEIFNFQMMAADNSREVEV